MSYSYVRAISIIALALIIFTLLSATDDKGQDQDSPKVLVDNPTYKVVFTNQTYKEISCDGWVLVDTQAGASGGVFLILERYDIWRTRNQTNTQLVESK